MPYDPADQTDCDVLVIGGGPAGSTVAARLAGMGWRVTVADKDRHPRFHIGESLLPRNLPILEELGVLEDVERMAVRKLGADLAMPDRNDYRKFAFAEANPAMPHAFQVKRAEFDHLLLTNAETRGATVHQGTRVTEVDFDTPDAVQVTATDDAGKTRHWRTRFVIDASGRDTYMAARMKAKARDPQHNSAAVFAHYRGVQRRPGADAGNTSVTWFDHGWFWTIPLADGVDSVGVVCHADYLKTRTVPLDQFLDDTIATCGQMAGRMAGAERISEVQAAGNYSYKSSVMHGDRYLLIGDAYAFLDPMFSTGVYLAMESAMRGAEAVDAVLRAHDPAPLVAHAAEMETGLQRLAWFIYKFNTPATQRLFMSRLNPLNMRQQVIGLLAGDCFGPSSRGIAVPAFKLAHRALSVVLR